MTAGPDVVAELDVVIFRKGGVDDVGECAEFVLQLPNKGRAVNREVDELAVYVAMQRPTVRRQLRALLYFS